jgi:hypothetical protein
MQVFRIFAKDIVEGLRHGGQCKSPQKGKYGAILPRLGIHASRTRPNYPSLLHLDALHLAKVFETF